MTDDERNSITIDKEDKKPRYNNQPPITSRLYSRLKVITNGWWYGNTNHTQQSPIHSYFVSKSLSFFAPRLRGSAPTVTTPPVSAEYLAQQQTNLLHELQRITPAAFVQNPTSIPPQQRGVGSGRIDDKY